MSTLPALSDTVPDPQKLVYISIKNKYAQELSTTPFYPPIWRTVGELALKAWDNTPDFLKKALGNDPVFEVVAYNAEGRVLTVRLLDQ